MLGNFSKVMQLMNLGLEFELLKFYSRPQAPNVLYFKKKGERKRGEKAT